MSKNIYLLRHGSVGADGRYIGRTELPLIKTGIKQLNSTKKLLQQERVEKILCSPLLRCQQTVNHIEPEVPVEIVPEIQEIDFGDFENLDFEQIKKKWPDVVNEWATAGNEFCFPQGESISHFRDRIDAARTIIDGYEEEHILIVSHGGVIRHLLCNFLGISYDNYLLFDVELGCYSTVKVFSEGGVLTGLNHGKRMNG